MPPASPVLSRENLSGGGISACSESCASEDLAQRYPENPAKAMKASRSAVAQVAQLLLNRESDFADLSGADSATQRRSIATSCADWMRSAGSLARQARTTRSSIGGVRGWLALMGSGSFSRIALNTLSCDLPSKARWPVIIS